VAKRDGKQKYLSIRMEDVLIKSIVTGGNNSEKFFNESIVLLFSKVRFEYSFNPTPNVQSPAGVSADYKFAWDIQQNKEW
jgi:type VI protein secretion system component Hcp